MRRRSILAGLGGLIAAQAGRRARGASQSADAPTLKKQKGTRIAITIERRQTALARSLSRDEMARRGPGGYVFDQGPTTVYFSKGLRHTPQYQCDAWIRRHVYQAIDRGDIQGVEAAMEDSGVLANPIASAALLDSGPDSVQYALARPPSINSRELALDALELCWAALCRDVPFGRYGEDDRIGSAVAELSNAGTPRLSSVNLFGPIGPNRPGPRVSQFLLSETVLGGVKQSLAGILAEPGVDYITSFSEFLRIQDGLLPARTLKMDPRARYPYSGRSLASIVYRDYPAQYFMMAAQQISDMGGFGAFNRSHPYAKLRAQVPFATFGLPHCFALLNNVACHALTVAWFYKWSVYRYLRPEEYFGLLHVSADGASKFPVPFFLRHSEALGIISRTTGTCLLPQAYPEGAPTHPSYPAGHAVVAGACGTILKFFFNAAMNFPAPVDVNDDGTALIPYNGELKIGDEIDKLMWNICYGRSYAGIHWRMDCEQGVRLGEQVARDLLQDIALFCAEHQGHVHCRSFFGGDMVV